MKKLSLNGLAELTGLDRRTVKARLIKLAPIITGRSHLYDPREALPLIYCAKGTSGDGDEDQLDQAVEQARLTHHKANIAELEEEELRGTLVKVDGVVDLWVTAIANAKTKLLALPSKITHQILAADDHKSALHLLKENIEEALAELASGDIRATLPCGDEAVDTATESET